MSTEHHCEKFDKSDIVHQYNREIISYYLYKWDDEYGSDIIEDISFCPFCGAHLTK